MAGNKAGSLKIAAKRIGISLEEYMVHINNSEKWCHKGRHWEAVTAFSIDRTRTDEHKAVCQECDYIRTTQAPGKRERQQKRLIGLAYCSRCKDWLSVDEVHYGLCRTHKNEFFRQRYATDEDFRNKVRQRVHARYRGIDPIPVEGQKAILEQFGGLCAYCGNPAEAWDHVYPISKKGITTPSNIVPACTSCNSSKGDRNVFEWLKAMGKVPSIELIERLILSECSPHNVYDFPE